MTLKVMRLFLTGIFMLIMYVASAQSYAESALLFSTYQPAGSARIQALGSAQIALGGDYSSALSNPAGLGMYNRSEITFSPALSTYSNRATAPDKTISEEKSSLVNIPGLSFVLHLPRESESGFLGGAFGISMTRVNDFNGTFSFSGVNENTSIVDSFLDQANGDDVSQFDSYQYNTPTGLAYFNYVIGPLSDQDPAFPDDEYFTDAPIESVQTENVTTKKAAYQWSFSYGGNFKDILFFGGGLGLTSLRYESQRIFTEDYFDQDTLTSLSLEENLSIRGSGINATLGVIVRPVSFLQIGLSFVSPTYYQITETYDAHMDAHWNNFDYDGTTGPLEPFDDRSAQTDIVTSEYSLTTPLRLSGGIAFISKYGFLSADVEMMNPAKAKYDSQIDGISYSGENEEIATSFKKIYNYRIGAEFRYNIFRLRAGYNSMGNPYADNITYKNTSISFGGGVRWEKFYIDLAFINRTIENKYSPYTLNDNTQPIVPVKRNTFTSMITFGFTF